MRKKKDRLEEIQEELSTTMTSLGMNPEPYSIAIRITAETLLEREKAYEEYIQDGGRQVTEKGRSNPSSIRLTSWNNQARACLSMLKLTPWRVVEPSEDCEE